MLYKEGIIIVEQIREGSEGKGGVGVRDRGYGGKAWGGGGSQFLVRLRNVIELVI